MRSFITSIRLKDGAAVDYDQLDREMTNARFTLSNPVISATEQRADKGREYDCLGGVSLQAVTEAAWRAAHRTGKQYSFTVIKVRS
jgi:hypothetical protein